ncbi:MAG TPA: glycosyltransferase [Steroidobacteraceae bacterium]
MSPQQAAGTWLFVVAWDIHHPGGVSQVVSNLFDTLARTRDWRPLLLVKAWEYRRRRPAVKVVNGRRTHYMLLRSPWERTRRVRNLIAFLLALPLQLLRLRRLIARENVRVVNIHYPALDAWSWLLVRPFVPVAPRIILAFHGLDLQGAMQERGIGRWLWRSLLQRVDVIVTCSEALRLDLITHMGCPAPRVYTIDNGVDPASLLSKAKDAPVASVPENFVLSLGTFEHKKGHDVLLRAFDAVAASYPHLHLVIAGRVGSESCLQELQALRDSLACADRIHLLQNVPHEEAMRILSRARLLVLASRKEPFGIVVLESGALSRPVIASDAVGVLQHLKEPDEILRVPVDDAPALSSAIRELIAQPERAAQMAAALHARVIGSFTWERILKDYLRLAENSGASQERESLSDRHKRKPLVTVGLPVYNGARFLRQALDSILGQTYDHLEVIISDNASTDDTVRICEEYVARDPRVRLVRHPQNIGAARNWNSLIPLARGEFFKWASSNDYIAPTMIEECLEALQKDPGAVLCAARTTIVNDDGVEARLYDHDVDALQERPSDRFAHICSNVALNNLQSGLIRTDVLRRTSLERAYPGGDLVFIAELALYGRFVLLPKPLFYRRLGAFSSTVALTGAALQEFWNPTVRRGGKFAQWRINTDYVMAALNADIPLRERLRAALIALRHASWQRAALWGELRQALLPRRT